MKIGSVPAKSVDGRIRIPYRWPAGRSGSEFLRRLRDAGVLIGRQVCDGPIEIPPGPDRLAEQADARWVTLSGVGTVTSWTVKRETTATAPPILALIRLDGADTALLHQIIETSPDAMHTGMRVQAVLAPAAQRTGAITDIVGFARVSDVP
jgi:uncharacterized OB-fold protein